MKTLNPEVFRKAARRIEDNASVTCCGAIRVSIYYDSGMSILYLNKFRMFFKPKNRKINDYWFGDFAPENQLARAFALDLMAEIIETENEK